MLNQDYRDILQCLNAQQVEFIVVGAYAIAAYGFPRSTADFDIWVNPTEDNALKVYRALGQFGAPLQDVSPQDFAEEGIIFQIGVAPCRIDLITKISGDIPFADAAAHAEYIEFGDVTMPVLSIEDLLKNKLATGRPKDLEDVKLLKKRRKLQR